MTTPTPTPTTATGEALPDPAALRGPLGLPASSDVLRLPALDAAVQAAAYVEADCAECGELMYADDPIEPCIADGNSRHFDCHRAQCREVGCLTETQRTAVL